MREHEGATVLLNDMLVQDNVELKGATEHRKQPLYIKRAEALPISLQDHSQAVRYLNIWIRELSTREILPLSQ